MLSRGDGRLLASLGAASVFFTGMWIGAWEKIAGIDPLHQYNHPSHLVRLSLGEGNLYLVGAIAQLPLVLLVAWVAARTWSAHTDERLRWYMRRPDLVYLVLGLWAAAIALCIAIYAFRLHPASDDESTYLFQAKLLLSGRLTFEAPAEPFAFMRPFLVESQGRWSGQYFWAQPAALAIGLALGSPHVLPLLFLVLTVLFAGKAAAEYAETPWAGLVASALVATSPLAVITSATLHNATLGAACAAVSVWSLVRLFRRRSLVAALALGISSGVGFHNRLFEHAIIVGTAGLIYLLANAPPLGEKLRRLWPAAAVLLPFVALHLAINAEVSGDPFKSGYALFNEAWEWTTFGFGVGPFGFSNSLDRALAKELAMAVHLAFTATSSAFVLAAGVLAALAFGRQSLKWMAPMAVPLALLVAHVFYSGFSMLYAGPVYFYPLVPVLAAWLGGALVEAHRWLNEHHLGRRLVPAFLLATTLGAALFFWPSHVVEATRIGASARTCVDLVDRYRVRQGLVFVPIRDLRTMNESKTRRGWLGYPPLFSPDLEDPVLFVLSSEDDTEHPDPARDARVAERYARGRPLYFARCLDTEAPTLSSYDPVTGEKVLLPAP